jgi:hypothetical protein
MSQDSWVNAAFCAIGVAIALGGGASVARSILNGTAGLPYGGHVRLRESPGAFWFAVAVSALVVLIGLVFAWHFGKLIPE